MERKNVYKELDLKTLLTAKKYYHILPNDHIFLIQEAIKEKAKTINVNNCGPVIKF